MQEIINQFALRNAVGTPRPLKVGFINDSYIIPAAEAGGQSYFLQRINHHIFTNVDGLQKNIMAVTTHIRKKLEAEGVKDADRRVLTLVPTKDGQLYYKTPEGDYWRMYLLIEDAESKEKITPESARLAGEAYGRFQCQLADIKAEDLCESIPNFHNLEFRMQQLADAIRDDKAGRVASQKEMIENLLARGEEMCIAERLYREGKLPKHIIHCDTKVNNILFDKQGRPMCIVDLDTVMPGFILSDFGDFMRTAANTGEEDDKNLDNIHVNLDIFKAFAEGYLKEATFLTPIEKELLPYSCRLLSFMQTVRFFTDYLNGDTYYKIQYPEHNLVRTLAQWRLFQEQEKVDDEMKAIINSL